MIRSSGCRSAVRSMPDAVSQATLSPPRGAGPPPKRRRWRRRGLLLHRDFLALWAGESVSYLGSRITDLALPLTAVLLLGASEEQMGVYGAIRTCRSCSSGCSPVFGWTGSVVGRC